jgi:hypothetical protein
MANSEEGRKSKVRGGYSFRSPKYSLLLFLCSWGSRECGAQYPPESHRSLPWMLKGSGELGHASAVHPAAREPCDRISGLVCLFFLKHVC